MDVNRIGQLLFENRVARKLTMRDVAKQSGVSIGTLSRIERAHRIGNHTVDPTVKTIEALALWLKSDLETLIKPPVTFWPHSPLCDTEIKDAVQKFGMIEPFVAHKVNKENNQPVVSYGLCSFGYDLRMGQNWRVFRTDPTRILEPGAVLPTMFESGQGDCVIPPHTYALVESLEYFKLPSTVVAIVQGKSTYARMGVIINCTPGEPGWEGRYTICVVNTCDSSVRLKANQGLAQIVFLNGCEPENGYAGKYQKDAGIALSKL